VSTPCRRAIVGSRDGLRQAVIDWMQLVRRIEPGLDFDGDGAADLDAQRIRSRDSRSRHLRHDAARCRAEPSAGVPNVSGGSTVEIGRLRVPNPTTTALVRAGALADRAVYFRHDSRSP
jgi:hypothetical protein